MEQNFSPTPRVDGTVTTIGRTRSVCGARRGSENSRDGTYLSEKFVVMDGKLCDF